MTRGREGEGKPAVLALPSAARRSLLLLLGVGVLTVVPVVLLFWQSARRTEWQTDRLRQHWQRRALAVIDDFRLGYTFESQVGEQLDTVLRAAGRVVRRTGTTPDQWGRALVRAFTRGVPPSHRPAGTRLFGFEVAADGACRPLRTPGLATAGGRVVGDLVGGACHPERLGGDLRKRLDNRCLGLFGTFVTFDLFSTLGRSRLLPVRFDGRNTWIYWDFVPRPDGTGLAFFAAWPRAAARTAAPLAHALRRARGERREFLPLLVPIESASASHRVHALPGTLPRPLLRRLVSSLIAPAGRERRIPPAQASASFPGFWIIRDAVHRNLPYELWLLTRLPPGLGRVPLPPEGFLLAVLVGGMWVTWFFRTVLLGLPGGVSLRTWFLGFFLLAGALPLTVLHLLGSFLIDSGAQRRMEDAVGRTLRSLEEVDAGSGILLTQFSQVCRERMESAAWRAEMRSHPCDRATPGLQAMFEEFAARGFPLRFCLAFRYGRDISKLVAPGLPPTAPRGFLDFFLPLMEGIAIRESPAKEAAILASLSDEEKYLLRAIDYSLNPSIYPDFYHLRDRAQVFTEGLDNTLWYYDFVSASQTLDMGIMFRAEARPAFQAYLSHTLKQVWERNREWHLLAGSRQAGGLGVEVRWRGRTDGVTGVGPLWRSMQGAVRGFEPRIQVGATGARLAYPCRHLPGFVVGVVVPFQGILADAAQARLVLQWALGLILLAMVLLAAGVGRHLLDPLRRLEESLNRAAGGDLSTRVGLARDDELGAVTAAFDQMIDGWRARRDLERFVSGTLDLAEEGTGEGAARVVEGAMLVSDIRSFTTLTEEHLPEAVVGMLNRHLDAMATAISEAGGRVDRFVGDAVIAAFFGPTPADAARQAVRGAALMRRAHLDLQARRAAAGEFVYEIGIGIDLGPIVLGTFGSDRRRERAAIGRVMKGAEHLEAMSKEGRSTRIIVSPAVRQACNGVTFRPLDGGAGWELAGLGEVLG